MPSRSQNYENGRESSGFSDLWKNEPFTKACDVLQKKIKFSFKNIFSKCDQICSFLRILFRSLTKNLIFRTS